MLADWLVHMYAQGISCKTALLYLDAIAGLYTAAVKEGLAEATEAFRDLRRCLRDADAAGLWSHPVTDARTDAFIALTRAAGTSLGLDLLLMSLLGGCMPMEEVARLRVTDELPASEMDAVAARHADARRSYIFPLDQSRLTQRQLQQRTATLVGSALVRAGLPAFGTPDATAATWWTTTALRCGIAGSDILAVLGSAPAAYPILGLCSESTAPGRRETAVAIVADTLTANPLRWYAMRLRPGVRFDTLRQRLDRLEGTPSPAQLFYPCDEIARRTGKKITFTTRPLIADVVFFRSRVTDIMPLFARIGDIAWCYTTGGRPGDPYAAIPQHAFAQFQNTIGHFTPDCRIAPLGTFTPRPGEKIVIAAGLFGGHSVDIKDAAPADDLSTIYRLHFDSANGIEWRVGVSTALLTPAP